MKKIITSLIFILIFCNTIFAEETGSYAEGEKDLIGGTFYPNYASSMMYKYTIYDHKGTKLLSKIVSPERIDNRENLNVKACNGTYPFDERKINLKNVKIYENGSEKTVDLTKEIVYSEDCVSIYRENLISDWGESFGLNASDFATYAVKDKTCQQRFLNVLREIGAYELSAVKNSQMIEGVSDQFESWLRTDVLGERPYVVCEPVAFMLPKNCYGTDGINGKMEYRKDGQFKPTKYVSGVEHKWYLVTVKDYKGNSKFEDKDILSNIIKVTVTGGSEGLQKCKAHLGVTQYKYKAPLLYNNV